MLTNKRVALIVMLALACLPLSTVNAMGEGETEPNAAELVREVRKSEMWLHDFDSLHIKAEGKWTITEKALADRRRSIKEQYGIENPDVRVYTDLIKEKQDALEIAADRKRVRYCSDDPSYWRQLKIWDGNELKIHEKYYHHPQECYVLNNKISERMFHEMFGCYYGWPRSQPHSFWWDKKDVNEVMNIYGLAEEFKFVGKQVFREIPCYVLEYEYPSGSPGNLVYRWYVEQSKHLLCGIETVRYNKVSMQHWMLDYREAVPGGWFPMKTGWSFYKIPELQEPYLESTRDLKIIEFHINEPLSNELFEMVIMPDVEIQDHRSGELKRYRKTQWKTLSGKSIPSFEGINIKTPVESGSLLVCFLDLEQRPSRHALQDLCKKSETFGQNAPRVLLIQASGMSLGTINDWRGKLKIPFEIGTITGNAKSILLAWGAKSLPWLILADKQHNVVAEGFAISKLDELIRKTN